MKTGSSNLKKSIANKTKKSLVNIADIFLGSACVGDFYEPKAPSKSDSKSTK